MRGVVSLCLTCAACLTKPPAPGGGTTGCTAPFQLTSEILGAAGSPQEYDAFEREDGLELWFASIEISSNTTHLSVATRATPEDAYVAQPFAFNAASDEDASPALSNHGLTLTFTSRRNGTFRAWESSRPSLDAPFTAPVNVLPFGIADAIDVSADGLTAYYSYGGDGDLYRATRDAIGRPFVTGELAGKGIAYGTVSADELEVFYNHANETVLYRATRTSKDEMFSGEARVFDEGADPQLSFDGTHMIVGIGDSLWHAERDCN